jgi:hypothetical protein
MFCLRTAGVWFAAVSFLGASQAWSDTLSTSANKPSPLPSTAVLSGSYPPGEAETSYYVAADLKAGQLATQISVQGGAKYKSLTFGLMDASGRKVESYYTTAGANDNSEKTRVIPVDSSGRYLIKITTEGPESASYKVALGGSALPQRVPAPADGAGPSRSFLSPIKVPADGVITGAFPGGAGYARYYFVTDLKAGTLMTQMSVSGRQGASKWMSLTMLEANGSDSGSSYHMSRVEANADATRSFPVDSSGRHVFRLTLEGAEGTQYRVELGGDALAAAK